MPSWLGPQELLIILLIAFLLFGAKRLPEIGRSIGRGIKEFKRGITELSDEVQKPSETDSTGDGKAG